MGGFGEERSFVLGPSATGGRNTDWIKTPGRSSDSDLTSM
jgi:hypothetical protein